MPEVYITNPLTKRAVKVGGRIYKRLLKNGDIVLKQLEPEPEPEPEPAPAPELEPLEPEPEESDSDDEYFNYKL